MTYDSKSSFYGAGMSEHLLSRVVGASCRGFSIYSRLSRS